MKKLLSALLCIAILSPYAAWAKAEERFVILDMPDCNAAVGEAIAYKIEEVVDGSLHEVSDYEVSSDSEQVIIDKENETVKAEKSGIYDITFEYGNFRKKVKFAASGNTEEQIKGEPVFSETFDDEIPACFQQLTGAVIREDSEGNRYLYVDARGKILNSGLFGGDLSDYVFEADIQSMGCDASSTSQLSVGMRAKDDMSAYRFANHDVVKYPGSGHSAGSGQLLHNAFSMSRSTSSPLLSAWYYAFVQDGYDEMYDAANRSHKKPYHWQIKIADEKMEAEISDIQTNETIAGFSVNTAELNNASAPLTSGGTTLMLHSMAAGFDNIRLSSLVKADRIELDVDKEVLSGKGNDNQITYEVSTVLADQKTQAAESSYEIRCEGAEVHSAEKTITFNQPGDYYIEVSCGAKYAVHHIRVSEEYAELANTDIELPSQAYTDFALPQPENVQVLYSSSNPEFLRIDADTAVVTRPGTDLQDQTVTVTAVIYLNTAAIVKKFDITIKKQTSDDEAIENAIKSITLPDETKTDLDLPTMFDDHVSCRWISGNPSLISDDGKVTQAEEDMRVRLTAHFSVNQHEKTVSYYVTVLGTSGKSSTAAIISTDQLNYEIGETVPVHIRVFDNLGEVEEIGAVTIHSDSSFLKIDQSNRTVSADTPGSYSFSVRLEKFNFEKELQIVFNNNLLPEAEDVREVYSEDFDAEDYDEAFKNNAAITVSDGKLNLSGRNQIYQTQPFGPRDENNNLIPLSEYIFEADINMTACYAGTTGQLSVGMRYDGDEDASYRVSHHEKIKYDEEECVVNTQNSEIQSHMLSMAYGKSVAATSWYLPFLQQSPASMFSGTGYSKVYHWKVMITDGVLCARISDPETGETVQEMSQKLEDLNTTKKGVKMVPLSSGATVLGTWSTDFQVDNIKISTMKAFDRLEIVLDKENSDKPGESIGMKIYSVSGEERTILPQSTVDISCSDPKLEIKDGSVKPLEEGEYFIHVRKGTKYALARLNVSGNGSKMEEALSAIELPESVMADFELPEAEGFDIQWMSSDESVILPQDGIAQVVRPSVGENDKIVTLTAVIRNGNIIKIKEFSITVCAETDDKNAIENAKQLLEIPQSVSSNIRLPEIIGDGVRVTWSSSNTGILENDGTVHRQGKDMRVTLTAILEKNQAKESVKFDITVLGTGTSGGSGSGSGSGSGGGGNGSFENY